MSNGLGRAEPQEGLNQSSKLAAVVEGGGSPLENAQRASGCGYMDFIPLSEPNCGAFFGA